MFGKKKQETPQGRSTTILVIDEVPRQRASEGQIEAAYNALKPMIKHRERDTVSLREEGQKQIEVQLKAFEADLESLVNRHCIDSIMDMPDFLVAEYLTSIIRNNMECIKKLFDWRTNGK